MQKLVGWLPVLVVLLLASLLSCENPSGEPTPRPTATLSSGSQAIASPTTSADGSPTPASMSTPAPTSYTVQSGDSLAAICAAELPEVADCISAIVVLNNLSAPDQITVGQVLQLPTGAASTTEQQTQATTAGAPAGETAVVARAVDGDTLALTDGRRVRLILVDTPETVDPNRPVGCYGPEASAFTKSLVEGQTVTLEKDVSETDRYDRLLRYVYLPDGRMLNEVLLSEGYAQVATYPPDVKYVDRFLADQAAARNAGLGLWGAACSEETLSPTSTPVVHPAIRPFRPMPSGLFGATRWMRDQGQHQFFQR